MASLYHSGSSSSVKPSVNSRMISEESVLPQYMGRQLIRSQFYVVPCPLPVEFLAGEQIRHLIGMSHVDPQILQRQFHKTGLHPGGIQIHDGQDQIAVVRGSLAVTNDLVIIDGVEHQIVVGLQ